MTAWKVSSGQDSFDGGSGQDTCQGDPGETFLNCEVIRQTRRQQR